MPLKPQEIVAQVIDRRKRSLDWMSSNFYGQWEQSYRNYKCEKIPYKDEITGKDDDERYSICLPDTLIAIRRFVARATSQIPQIGYRGEDREISRGVSRKLMYDWDKGGMQMPWKRNITQTGLFGWSVMGFHWAVDEYPRRRKVDLERLRPGDLEELQREFGLQLVQTPNGPMLDPIGVAQVRAKFGGSRMIPVERIYRAFTGAKGHCLFVGDCFPEPDFMSIQESNWFIVERRRNREFLRQVAKVYPEMRHGILALFDKYPNGNPSAIQSGSSNSVTRFRDRLRTAINRVASHTTQSQIPQNDSDPEWNILEMHTPGRNGKLTLIGEDSVFVGELSYPFDLDGKIAFSETTFIPDILSGIGDSTARLIRKLADAHNVMFENRLNLADKVSRPLLATVSRKLFENPDLLKRGKGFRLVLVDSPNDLQYPNEQAALAAMQAGMAEDGMLQREIQKATGESNLSMMAGVDPAQARTATGARIMQTNLDVLSKSDLQNITDSGVRGCVEIMFGLNASELVDTVRLDPTEYDARWAEKSEKLWMEAQPYHFQGEGSLYVEPGSTLADDDEANNQRAMNLWMMANQRPDIINARTAAEFVIESFGERNRMDKWIMPPAPPPQPEPPKKSLSLSGKLELLPPEVQMKVIEDMGIQIGEQPPGGPGMPPGMAPGGPPPPEQQELPLQ